MNGRTTIVSMYCLTESDKNSYSKKIKSRMHRQNDNIIKIKSIYKLTETDKDNYINMLKSKAISETDKKSAEYKESYSARDNSSGRNIIENIDSNEKRLENKTIVNEIPMNKDSMEVIKAICLLAVFVVAVLINEFLYSIEGWRISSIGFFDGNTLTLYSDGSLPIVKSEGSIDADKKIEIAKSVGSIDADKIKNVIILEGVTFIEEYEFSDCSNLGTITLPESVSSIGSKAFLNCSNLKSIIIPNSVNEIQERTFEGCTKLESITLTDNMTVISDFAFANCTSLKTVKMPSGLKEIGKSIFYNCTGIKKITIPGDVESIGEGAFYGWTSDQIIEIEGRSSAPYVGWDNWNDGCKAEIRWMGYE